MRARNIKPGIFKNEQLAACSIGARWLFPGLWCLADWCGRLEDRPLRIKMEIFPADGIAVEPLLEELVGAGLIVRYRASGPDGEQGYIWIPKFRRHQTPHQNERCIPSRIPACPEDDEGDLKKGSLESGVCRKGKVMDNGQLTMDNGERKAMDDGERRTTIVLREDSGSAPGVERECDRSTRAESRILNPESGMLNADTRKPNPESGKRNGESPRGAVSVSAVLPGVGFDGGLAGRQVTLGRLMALGDGAEYGPWWEVVLARMAACDGLGVVLEALQRAEDAQDAVVRKAKDMGLLSKPQNFVAAACGKWLKAHGSGLPRPPGPSRVVAPGGNGLDGRRGFGGRM